MPLPKTLDLGAVHNGKGEQLADEGFLTYGPAMEPEIEITPPMIAAGTLAYSKGDLRFDSPDEIVSRIFRAMMANRPNGQTNK
jgi:hypothetical protein